MECPSVTSQICSPVADVITRPVTTGLRQCNLGCWHSIIPSPAAPVAPELGGTTRVLFHISPLLQQLHWLRALDRIQFKLAVLMYKCLHGTAPSYLADELEYTADFEAQRRLQSASSLSLNVRHTRLSTVDDGAFPVAAVHTWNSLPQHVCFLCMFSEVASSGIISQDFHRNFCTTCSLAQ